ncbi:MAG: hypothetical protein KAS66_03345 [Candidatus Omnitrophica bacterium]|nr:hypothetical protein [Candidatus Omnitrophota bacterium]
MDDEKLKEILTLKEAELISLEKHEVEIRNSVTDENYTAEELANRDRGAKILPEEIIYELRPLWQTSTKLKIEIKCIRHILRESEKDAA